MTSFVKDNNRNNAKIIKGRFNLERSSIDYRENLNIRDDQMLNDVCPTARCASPRTSDRSLLDSDTDRPTNGEHVLERRGEQIQFRGISQRYMQIGTK